MVTLTQIADALDNGPRLGDQTDEPEGHRYIKISDTLAKAMAATLRRFDPPLTGPEFDDMMGDFDNIYYGLTDRAKSARNTAKKAWRKGDKIKHDKFCSVARVYEMVAAKLYFFSSDHFESRTSETGNPF